MAIELVGYRAWQGNCRPAWTACWPIARTGIVLVLRRKSFWLLLGLALLSFLFTFSVIYIKAQLVVQHREMGRFFDAVRVTGSGDAYLDFMFFQGTVTMLLMAFAGSQLVGADYRQGGLTFYLSKRIAPRHYCAGKVLAIASLVAMITMIPALVLYAEYGLLTDSLGYFRENYRILFGILGYGSLMALVLALLVAAIASWVPRTVPLVMTWTCIFVLIPLLSENLQYVTDNPRWVLINLWRDLRILGRWCFDSLRPVEEESHLAYWAAYIVPAVCVLCLIALARRVRAVEVVR